MIKNIFGNSLSQWIADYGLHGEHTVLGGGGWVLPYKGLMGTCGQPGYVFQDFCLKTGYQIYHVLS